MSRRFAVVTAYEGQGLALPARKTARSAGYDLAAAERVELGPGQVALVPTGVKAYMPADEHLQIHIRSSLAVKRGLTMFNGVGIIDADYCDNPDNEGQIFIPLRNSNSDTVVIERGERIAQAIFVPYGVTADDQPGGDRLGGFGSTGS